MSLFADLPVQKRQEPAERPAAGSPFTHPRPAVQRPLTAGERACACGMAATCAEGAATFCPWCAPATWWPRGRAG